ncbi:MAG TPA: pirin family protein [Acidimicrobiia bacterium]|nr:pirin family protein [Acidimicrobiia bacterium]
MTIVEGHGTPRKVRSLATARHSFEGAGFPVARPFPQPGAEWTDTDPFLMLDEMGPIEYAPGEAKGAPDHPHRGFETVTYLFAGEMEHRDSTGGGGLLRAGDTQWMTAGAGIVHSETPTAEMLRDGGLMHGVQLWVNLPRAAKRERPRYQDLAGERVPTARSADGRALLRVIAGSLGGLDGPGSTHTPIVYAHATLEAGAELRLDWQRELNALVYVFEGSVRVDGETVEAQQLAVLDDNGDTVSFIADDRAEVLLLGGQPIREPVAWYGPFVMNTKDEIVEAFDDFEAGRMGSIAPLV